MVPIWVGQLRALIRLLQDYDYLSFGQIFDTQLDVFQREADEMMTAIGVVGTEIKPGDKK